MQEMDSDTDVEAEVLPSKRAKHENLDHVLREDPKDYTSVETLRKVLRCEEGEASGWRRTIIQSVEDGKIPLEIAIKISREVLDALGQSASASSSQPKQREVAQLELVKDSPLLLDVAKVSFLKPRLSGSLKVSSEFLWVCKSNLKVSKDSSAECILPIDDISRIIIVEVPRTNTWNALVVLKKPVEVVSGGRPSTHDILILKLAKDSGVRYLDKNRVSRNSKPLDFIEVFSSIVGKDLEKEAVFKSKRNPTGAIECHLHTDSGMIFPLSSGLLYLNKPALFVPRNGLKGFSIGSSESGTSSRFFDMQINLHCGKSFTFGMIAREHFSDLEKYMNDVFVKAGSEQNNHKASHATKFSEMPYLNEDEDEDDDEDFDPDSIQSGDSATDDDSVSEEDESSEDLEDEELEEEQEEFEEEEDIDLGADIKRHASSKAPASHFHADFSDDEDVGDCSDSEDRTITIPQKSSSSPTPLSSHPKRTISNHPPASNRKISQFFAVIEKTPSASEKPSSSEEY